MNASSAFTPAVAAVARAMSAATAGQSFQATGPEHAGRCCSGEANWLEQRGELGKLRLAGAARRRVRTFEAGETILDVDGVVGPALFTVVDDVDAGFDLLAHHIGDGAFHRRLQRRAARAWAASASASKSSTTFAGRGRLPVWLVRMRSVLRFMGSQTIKSVV